MAWAAAVLLVTLQLGGWPAAAVRDTGDSRAKLRQLKLSDERVVFQTQHGDIEMAFYPDVSALPPLRLANAHCATYRALGRTVGCTPASWSAGRFFNAASGIACKEMQVSMLECAFDACTASNPCCVANCAATPR